MNLFLTVPCACCGREGVWLVGGAFVVHTDRSGITWGCELPPRDVDRLTARQRASLRAATRAATNRAKARPAA